MSNLSAFPYIPERSQATPGLWNYPLSIISANIAALDSGLTSSSPSGNTFSFLTNIETSGGAHFQFLSVGSTPPSYVTTAAITVEVNSAYSDYLYFADSSAQKSSYVIGSRAGNLADGLNIWDASAGTMIASFSKQSIRFFQNVVGPVFDTGGALASTYNAATFGTGAQSIESRIQAAINQASIDGVARVYVPANMLPYSASSMSFIYTVQMVREGGDWSNYDVRAYGAYGDGVRSDSTAFQQTVVAAFKGSGGINGGSELQAVGGSAVILSPTTRGYRLDGTVIQLPGVSIIGNQTLLAGAGTNIGFDSGTLVAGVATSNFGSAVGLNEIHQGHISGLRMRGFGVGIRWTNAIRASNIERCYIQTQDSNQSQEGIQWYRCFASAIRSVHVEGFYSRASGSVHSQAAIRMEHFCNNVALHNVYTHATELGLSISSSYGVVVRTSVLEGANVALDLASGNLNRAITVDGNYFENNNTGILVGSRTTSPSECIIDRNFFSINSVDVDLVGCDNLYLGPSNRYEDVNTTFHIRSGHSAKRVLVDFGIYDDATTNPWADAQYSLTNGVVVQRVLYTSQTTTSRTSLKHWDYYNASNQGGIVDGSLLGTQLIVDGLLAVDSQPNYINLYDFSGNAAVFLGGSGDPQNYYRNTDHRWQSSGGGLTYMNLSSTRLGPGADGAITLGVPATRWGDSYLTRLLTADGSSIAPTHVYSSETSLGLFRSAGSTIALSYGTIDLTTSGAITSIASLKIKAGANNSCGTAVLGSNGSVNVANTYVKTGDLIFLTDQAPGGTLGDLELGGIRNSSGFTIQSTSLTDTSTVAYLIIRPG